MALNVLSNLQTNNKKEDFQMGCNESLTLQAEQTIPPAK